MAGRRDIDDLLDSWPYDPEEVTARLVRAKDGRQVLQMRIEMGLLQMEVEGRPDGARPEGCETYYDYLLARAVKRGDDFSLTDEQCQEADREFIQFYHRRICWLRLREHRRAVKDADHSLAFMDFCRKHSPSEEWTLSHEQYRPFILFHRTQALALAELDEQGPEQGGPERAIEAIQKGLNQIRAIFVAHEAEEQFDDDELVQRLVGLQDRLREHFEIGKTLREQLAEAVAAEKYELAARLRDEIEKRKEPDGA
jgi:UvrB/uvrC motif